MSKTKQVEAPEIVIEKDRAKLFNDVDVATYQKWYVKLCELRLRYPGYRDDQLLMALLCQQSIEKG